MNNSAYKLVNSIANNITLPDVYWNIKELIITPEARIDDYVAVIQMDPALSMRLIKITNSSFFGYARKVDNLKKAISFIGVMQLHDILLSTLIIRAFSGIPDHIINLKSFWHHAVFSGVIARQLAKKFAIPASERLFTSGLLHDIGHIVLYIKEPELAQQSLIESEQQAKSLVVIQREKIGVDYAQLGYELMHIWHLPESYQKIIAFHAEPEKATAFQVESAIVNLARKIAIAESTGETFSLEQRPPFPESTQNITLSPQYIKNITGIGRQHVDEVLGLLWPHSQPIPSQFIRLGS